MHCRCGLFRIEAEVRMWDEPPTPEFPEGHARIDIKGYAEPLLAQGALEQEDEPFLLCPVCGTEISSRWN